MRVVEFNASTPFRVQLEAMAASGMFVSVHTSNLANAQFLQPGAAVLELLQRNWVWDNLDRSFQVASFGLPCIVRPDAAHCLPGCHSIACLHSSWPDCCTMPVMVSPAERNKEGGKARHCRRLRSLAGLRCAFRGTSTPGQGCSCPACKFLCAVFIIDADSFQIMLAPEVCLVLRPGA